jgi:hypothetical protein
VFPTTNTSTSTKKRKTLSPKNSYPKIRRNYFAYPKNRQETRCSAISKSANIPADVIAVINRQNLKEQADSLGIFYLNFRFGAVDKKLTGKRPLIL